MKKKTSKLDLKRISIRELSPRDLRDTAGGAGVVALPGGIWHAHPPIEQPSGCCYPPPADYI